MCFSVNKYCLNQIFTDSTITDFDAYRLLNTDFRHNPTWALQVYFIPIPGNKELSKLRTNKYPVTKSSLNYTRQGVI